jgi:hypothetical protein
MATPTNLPASFSAGNVLTATQQNNLRGAFRILQVVQGSTSTVTSNSTTTYTDTTLTATITCQSATSKVLVLVSHGSVYKSGGNVFNGVNLRLLRGATVISTFGAGIGYTGTALDLTNSCSTSYLDSPATTLATTYKTQFANNAAAASVQVQVSSSLSTIILLEVSA